MVGEAYPHASVNRSFPLQSAGGAAALAGGFAGFSEAAGALRGAAGPADSAAGLCAELDVAGPGVSGNGVSGCLEQALRLNVNAAAVPMLLDLFAIFFIVSLSCDPSDLPKLIPAVNPFPLDLQ